MCMMWDSALGIMSLALPVILTFHLRLFQIEKANIYSQVIFIVSYNVLSYLSYDFVYLGIFLQPEVSLPHPFYLEFLNKSYLAGFY